MTFMTCSTKKYSAQVHCADEVFSGRGKEKKWVGSISAGFSNKNLQFSIIYINNQLMFFLRVHEILSQTLKS